VSFLISGPQGADKTTVASAAAVARSFERGVHVEGDAFRNVVVSGRTEMSPDASDDALAQRLGTWIEDGRLTPEETAAAILRR
jgi:hypothetical protein